MACLSLDDILLHLWERSAFEDIITTIGYLLEVDSDTHSRRKVDRAWVKVGYSSKADMTLLLIVIVEDLSFWLRVEIEKSPPAVNGVSVNPSRSAVFKHFFVDLGVQGEEKGSPIVDRNPTEGPF